MASVRNSGKGMFRQTRHDSVYRVLPIERFFGINKSILVCGRAQIGSPHMRRLANLTCSLPLLDCPSDDIGISSYAHIFPQYSPPFRSRNASIDKIRKFFAAFAPQNTPSPRNFNPAIQLRPSIRQLFSYAAAHIRPSPNSARIFRQILHLGF